MALQRQRTALVVQDQPREPGRRAAYVWAEHDRVLRVLAQLSLVQPRREELDVRSAAVDELLVPHRKLQHQRLVLVLERLHLGRVCVVTIVLERPQACVERLVRSILAASNVNFTLS